RSKRRTLREHSRNGWNGCEQFRSAAEARGTSTLQYCGTFAQREELSENTRGTAGMVVSSSGVQQKQEEHRRNRVPILRNIRSKRRTLREHSRNGWNGCEQFRSAAEARGTWKDQVPILRNIRSQRRTLRE